MIYLNNDQTLPVESVDIVANLIIGGSIDHARIRDILINFIQSACNHYHINPISDDHVAALLEQGDIYERMRKRLLEPEELERHLHSA